MDEKHYELHEIYYELNNMLKDYLYYMSFFESKTPLEEPNIIIKSFEDNTEIYYFGDINGFDSNMNIVCEKDIQMMNNFLNIIEKNRIKKRKENK